MALVDRGICVHYSGLSCLGEDVWPKSGYKF